ncbi:unnamed protein product [Medioppia subpectinata]|uniref:Uncharacterized protein n=1 Tax=Medioppia subpectinata TaxID=1979941 RepID=A0A7R9Q134_9ACAR|nr:unnamed protein product [Medioppia subpectinata]CAG2108787.1 unnamed protein product [Medioppia subpectinata]
MMNVSIASNETKNCLKYGIEENHRIRCTESSGVRHINHSTDPSLTTTTSPVTDPLIVLSSIPTIVTSYAFQFPERKSL